jgi:hypothetical protein
LAIATVVLCGRQKRNVDAKDYRTLVRAGITAFIALYVSHQVFNVSYYELDPLTIEEATAKLYIVRTILVAVTVGLLYVVYISTEFNYSIFRPQYFALVGIFILYWGLFTHFEVAIAFSLSLILYGLLK